MNKSSYTAANVFPAKLLYCKSVKNSKILPLHIQLCPTNLCNLNCSFCSCSERNKKDTLSLQDIKKTMLTYKALGTTAVTITGGGEPLLHPEINEIIDYINRIGIKIGLVTNGTQFKKLSNKSLSKLTWCRISISDDRELNFEEIPRTSPTTDWAFSYVLTKNTNYKNIFRTVQFANKHKFTHVRIVSDILDLKSKSNMSSVCFSLKGNDRLVIYQDRQRFTSGIKKCLISLLKPVITADGLVYPCCGVQYALKDLSRDFEKSMSMGTIDDIIDIYNKQKNFNGENCVRCYYSDYNQALDLLTQDLSHIEFV